MANKRIINAHHKMVKKLHHTSFISLGLGAVFLSLIAGIFLMPFLILIDTPLVLFIVAIVAFLLGMFFDKHLKEFDKLNHHHHIIFILLILISHLINIIVLFYTKRIFYYVNYIPHQPEIVYGVYLVFFFIPYLLSYEKGRHIVKPNKIKPVHSIAGIKY